MALINLQTNLKSLRYGKDTPGSGDSGQPYIQTPIPRGFVGASEDFLLRGGINTVTDSLTDVARLGKMFTDTRSPNGLLFIAKQQLLSRTAVRTQTSGILNEGVYSPLNTLAQAGVVAFGGHLNKQGINPFSETGAYANNETLYNTRVKSNQLIGENRLVQLWNGSRLKESVRYDGNKVILNDGINVMVYVGGPGSDLGIGKTNIRYSFQSQTPLTKSPGSYNFTSTPTNQGQNDWSFSPELISVQSRQNEIKGYASPQTQDFRAVLRRNLVKGSSNEKQATTSGATSLSLSYDIAKNQTIEGRVNLGNPGARAGKSYADYSKGVTDINGNPIYGSQQVNANGKLVGTYNPGLDKITSIPIYRSETTSTELRAVNDLVKFRIAVIDNNSPSFKTFIHFRAFIDSMSDSYNANWNGFNYLGRSEQFYNYGGYTRNVSLSWTVAAQSKQELIPMYKKLNYLASSLTGDYSPNGYMRGNLVQLTVGGYLYEQPGIITSLTYDVPSESPWEIGIGTSFDTSGNATTVQGDDSVKELPHIIRVTGFNFIPIQNFVPRKQQLTFAPFSKLGEINNDVGFVEINGPERYIALSNGQNNNYDNNK